MNPRFRRPGFLLSILFVAVCLLQGQACSPPATSLKATDDASGGGGGDTGKTPPAQTKSGPGYRVAHAQELLPTLISTLDITPSQNLLNLRTTSGRNLSETGAPDSISAPMWNSVVTMTGAACAEAVTKERALPADQRKIFKSVDFARGPASQEPNAMTETIRRLARGGWLRDETEEERNMILKALAVFATDTTADTASQTLFLCSAMLSSLDAQVRE